MLKDLICGKQVYVVTGYTDLRKSIVTANQSQPYAKRKKHGKIAPKKYLKELTAG